ncbi:MAG: LamG domain-containing protein, partial [Planctomycetota bacterium]
MCKRLTLLVVAVVVLGLTGAARCELVARYPFDDGTADDRAYYYEDADGTFFDDAEVTEDAERGSVLSLDGTGDYVKVLNNEVANFSTESFTFSFWAQCSTLSSWYYFWRGRAFEGLKGVNCFHDVDSGEVRFTLYNMPEVGKARVNAPDANFVTGKWIHIACVRDADADELRLYVNGELEPPAADSSNPQEDTVKNISNTGQLYIGADDRTGPTDFFYGRIDDFRVYNHALSVQELEQLASDYVDPNLASDPSPPDGAQ